MDFFKKKLTYETAPYGIKRIVDRTNIFLDNLILKPEIYLNDDLKSREIFIKSSHLLILQIKGCYIIPPPEIDNFMRPPFYTQENQKYKTNNNEETDENDTESINSDSIDEKLMDNQQFKKYMDEIIDFLTYFVTF
jgi:hypothetical protein